MNETDIDVKAINPPEASPPEASLTNLPTMETEIAGQSNNGQSNNAETITSPPMFEGSTNIAGEPQPEGAAEGAKNREIPLPEFMQILQTMGIDLETQGPDIQKFYDQAKEIGIVQIMAMDLDDDAKAELIKGKLINAEGDPKEGLKKFAAIAGIALESLGGWLAETSQETLEGGMLRLIRALFEGANYNSAGSLRSRETANEGEVVTDADFFMMMREKPQDAIEKLLESSPQLEKAGWAIGSRGLELLRKGKGDSKVAKEALMAVFVGTGQDGIISLSDHLNATDRYERWKDVGGVLAEYLFNKKMLSLDIEKQLEDLSSGRQDPKSGTYFGT